MRRVASVIAGAAVAAVGGLVLGEYPFTGWTPWVAGVLFALVVTEVMITVGRTHGPVVGIGGGVFSAGGLGWAVWISSGRGVEPIGSGGWLAIALGFAVAMVRGFLPVIRRAPAPAAGAVPDDSPTALERLDEFIAPAATTLAISRSGRFATSGPRHEAEGSSLPSSGRMPESTAPDATPETTAAGAGPATPGPATPGLPATPRPETAPPASPARASTAPRRNTRAASSAKKAAATTKRTAAGRVSTAKQAAPAAKAPQATKGSPAKKAASATKKSGAAKAAPTKRGEKGKTASTAKKAGAASARKTAAVKAAKSPAPRSRSGRR